MLFPNARYDDQVDFTAQALAWAKQRPAAHAMFECWRRLAEEGGGIAFRQRHETSEPTSTPSLRGALATKQSRGDGTCGARGPQTQCCGPWINSIARSQRRDWRRFVRQDRPEADRSRKVRIEVAPLRVHCLDQGHLLDARAALELLFARDRIIHAFIGLVEHQQLAPIAARETFPKALAVLADALRQVDVTPV